jgi:hypothetical protein
MPKNLGVIFPKYLYLNLKKIKLVRKTPKLAKSVTISYIHLFLVVDNPPKLVPFLTVFLLRPLSSTRHPIPMKTRNRIAGGIFNCPPPTHPHPRWDIVEGEPVDSTSLVDISSNKMKKSLKFFVPPPFDILIQ